MDGFSGPAARLIRTRLTRRLLVRSTVGTGAAVAASGGRWIPSARALSQSNNDPPMGGSLKVAIAGEPPSVADAMFTTALVTADIGQHAFEGLFALDAAYVPQPLLAESSSVSEDGTRYEFVLRPGILFHDGSALTAADAVASLRRWGEISGRGGMIFERLDKIEATDPATVVMTFAEPTGLVLDFLADRSAFIMPAAIAEAAGTDQLADDQIVGTGPFRLVEHEVDRYIRFARFDGYAPQDSPANGFAGRRVAYLDEIEFIPVPDATVRASGVLTGEYHFADEVDLDQYDVLNDDPLVVPLIVDPYESDIAVFNKKQGLFTDARLRRAVALAVPRAEAMLAAWGREEFVRADPSLSTPGSFWHSTVGQEEYGRVDPEVAKALLAEAEYDGRPVRWLTTREYPNNYRLTEFAKQQLETIGMPVELVVSDWATLVERRAAPEEYEVFSTGFSTYLHPVTQSMLDPEWPGWWIDPEKERLVGAILSEPDPEAQKQLVDALERLVYDEAPFIKWGDAFGLRAARAEVDGYANGPRPFFWNVGLS